MRIYRDIVTLFIIGCRYSSRGNEQYKMFVASLLHVFVPKPMVHLRCSIAKGHSTLALPAQPINEPQHFLESTPSRNCSMAFRERGFHQMENDRVSLVDPRETCVSLNCRGASCIDDYFIAGSGKSTLLYVVSRIQCMRIRSLDIFN